MFVARVGTISEAQSYAWLLDKNDSSTILNQVYITLVQRRTDGSHKICLMFRHRKRTITLRYLYLRGLKNYKN